MGLILLAFCGSAGYQVWQAYFRFQAYGTVTGRTIQVSSPWDGVVRYLHVRPGDKVRQGQLLLTLDNLALRQSLARVEDDLAVAQANFEAEAAKLKWQSAYSLDQSRGAVASYYEAQATLLQEQARLEDLSNTFHRTKQLERRGAITREELEHSQFATQGQLPVVAPSERLPTPRRTVTRPLVLVPVLPTGGPDWDRRVEGDLIDVSERGIGMLVDLTPSELPTASVVLLAPEADGIVRCAGMEVRHTRRVDAAGLLRIGAEVGGIADELLREDNLSPRFCPQSLRYTWNIAEEALRRWADVGVLDAIEPERVMVCPRCHALPTFRQGCRNCGSGRTQADQLVHHFACAHVGHLSAFQCGEDLACPKCHTRTLVIGSDYEHQTGPFRCQACHWTDAERIHVAHCLGCGLRFPSHQAQEQELASYRVNRLDLLAFAAPSRAAPGVPDRPVAHGRPAVCPQ